MDQLITSTLAGVHSALTTFFHLPGVPLYIAGVAIFMLAGMVIYIVLTAPTRARSEVSDLLKRVDEMGAKLMDAERIAQIGSFVWDFQDRSETFWSPHLYQVLGVVPRQTPPDISVLVEIAHPDDKTLVQQNITEIEQRTGPFSFIFRVVHATGEVHSIRVEGISEATASQLRIRGVMQDISKEREVDRAKTEFVSLASHQLKAPLTSIRWLSETLLSGSLGAFSDKQREFLTKVHDESTRMMDMVNDLLNVSRIELGTLATRQEDIDVATLLAEVADQQHQTAEAKHITMSLTCASDIPHMQGDRNQAQMVLQNLLSNAIKYTPEGGTVSCDISLGGAQQSAIFIRVSDTGIGIPKADQPHLFEKLHRASNAEKFTTDGTGLGLYVVKTVVENAGGGITFESVENKGTTFYVSLPTIWKQHAPEAGRQS